MSSYKRVSPAVTGVLLGLSVVHPSAWARSDSEVRALADKGEIIGRWIEPGAGALGLVTIRKKGTGFVLLGKPLGKPEEEISALVEKPSRKGRRFDVPDSHDRYTIRPDGALDISDDAGLIDTARPVPKTMTDMASIDKAISKTIVKSNSAAFWMPIEDAGQLATFADKLVRPRLKDPSSGRFAALQGATTDKGSLMCGLVNAKNGFGGYNGSQRFVAGLTDSFSGMMMVEAPTQDVPFKKYWSICTGGQ